MKQITLFALFGALLVLPITLTADGGGSNFPYKDEVNNRMNLMNMVSFFTGQLGDMARGKVDYDAEAAQAAADNLLKLASLDETTLWPAGSDNQSEGMNNKTRAKANIWSDMSGFMAKQNDLTTAAEAMAANAGNGLDGLRSSMGDVGNSCKGCHREYRGPKLKNHSH